MLAQRIATGAILGVLVVATVLWLGPLVAGLVLGAFWLLGVREWAGFARLAPLPALVYVAIAALAMAGASQLLGHPRVIDATLAVAAAWWLVALVLLARHPRPVPRPLTIAAGMAALVSTWVLLAFLHVETAAGPRWVLSLLAIVWAADVGAYAFGRLFGRHKLAPRISPGKTWEGVVGGVVCASATGALAGRVLGVDVVELAVLAGVTAVGSVIGDLTVSLFKRNAGLKDSGRLLPGHGGVLDRVDSLTAAAAVFVLGLLATGIIT